VLGGTRLFVKRDDHMSLGGGGNKLRKLEFLLGEALRQGADVVMTVGGLQSNHARLTAAAATRAGMECELVLARMVPREDVEYTRGGNVLLDDLFGARVTVLASAAEAGDFAAERRAALEAEGRKVYFSQLGGSTPVGCLGYAQCAAELMAQAGEMGLRVTEVVLANGSSGTHAGLVAGFAAMGADTIGVKSFSVLALEEETRKATWERAVATAALLGAVVGEGDIRVDGTQRGEGYGIPTEGMIEAVRLLARTEGLLLDPVYSGKAFAGFISDIRAGVYRDAGDVVFLMTGGVPGIFAYRGVFLEG